MKKKNTIIRQILKHKDFTTKISIYFSSNTAGDDFDPYEANYTKTQLNPKTIKGYVRDISPESLVWRSYGIAETGAKEVLCEKRYKNYFLNAARIEIDGDEFTVYISATGNRVVLTEIPFETIKVVLSKKQ